MNINNLFSIKTKLKNDEQVCLKSRSPPNIILKQFVFEFFHSEKS